MWQGGDFPLELLDPIRWREKNGEKKREKEKEKKRGRKKKRSEKLHLLSRFYGDRAVSFCQNKRKSSSTQREPFKWHEMLEPRTAVYFWV